MKTPSLQASFVQKLHPNPTWLELQVRRIISSSQLPDNHLI